MIDHQTALPKGIPRLDTYYIYLTRGCNLACQHCWINPNFQSDGGTGGHLDYRLFEHAIEEGLPLGLRSVKLTGGEPLLHPDFIRIVDHLKLKNLKFSMETNGILVSEKFAFFLKEKSTLSFVSVSLDGATPETHDAFRGVKGSFEKTCSAIRNLAKVGYRPQVIMSIHSGNVSEIESFIQLVEHLGAGSAKFNIIQTAGRGERLEMRGKLLNIQRLIEIGNWIENQLQKKTSIPLLYGWPIAFQSLRKIVNPKGICTIHNILGILPTGHLAMCGIGIEVPELLYGLIGQNSIYDIWVNNPTIIEIRKTIPAELEGVCGSCLLKQNCLGSCIAQNFFLGKRLTAPFWFCQLAYKNNLFPQTRLQIVKENQLC